jgi:MoaA/NifB/PqqE/SkfB family radical SAM enzyme
LCKAFESLKSGSYHALLLKYLANRITGRLRSMPVLVLMPHSRCNCKCVMCDIWKANATARELTAEDLEPHLEAFRKLGVEQVLLSGGEPLMHSNLWAFCRQLKSLEVRITLLSTGLTLKENAQAICENCSEVIVSLDGSREIHNEIRRVPQAFDKLQEGIAALRSVNNRFRITGRCVLQRRNYHDIRNIVQTSRSLGLDQISFLAADVSSTAFNRANPWPDDRVDDVALGPEDITRFASLVQDLIQTSAADFEKGFIAESPEKLRRLPAYYSATRGVGEFPANHCNAPWVSAVVEADGSVRPCFFHKAFGNIHDRPFFEIVNGSEAVRFRRQLDVSRDPVCVKCVCTLNRSPRSG